MRYLCTVGFFHDWSDSRPQEAYPADLRDCPDHSQPPEAEGEDHRELQLAEMRGEA